VVKGKNWTRIPKGEHKDGDCRRDQNTLVGTARRRWRWDGERRSGDLKASGGRPRAGRSNDMDKERREKNLKGRRKGETNSWGIEITAMRIAGGTMVKSEVSVSVTTAEQYVVKNTGHMKKEKDSGEKGGGRKSVKNSGKKKKKRAKGNRPTVGTVSYS